MCVDSFVLRVKDQQRRLYASRELYVSIRRGWQKGSLLFFIAKTTQDVITGAGTLDRVIELDLMDEQEQRFCRQNNWYGKMIFKTVERFVPPLPLQDTPLAGTKAALLHGFAVSERQTTEIGRLVHSRIIS